MKRVARRTNSVMALLLVAVMTLAGCGSAASSGETTQTTSQETTQATASNDPIKAEIAKGPVTLVGYQFGDDTVDHKTVLAEVNKKLEKDINTTLDLRGISWTDAEKKYKLIFASGEEFDFCYSGAWIGFNSVATTKGYMPLSMDMVKTYAPDTFAATSVDRWKQVTLNGNIYGLPNINAKVKNVLTVFRGDILKKYNIATPANRTDFVNSLLTIAKGEKDLLAWNVGNAEQNGRMRGILYAQAKNLKDVVSGLPVLSVGLDDSTFKIFKTYEDPDYLEYLKTTKQLADTGVWSKSALANKDADENNFKAEKSAVYIADAFETFDNNNAAMTAINPDYANVYTDINPGHKLIPEGGNMSLISVHATSKHPERVMMMFNQFETNKEYYDLVTYGVEGTHYTAVGADKYTPLLPKFNDFGGFTMSWGSNNSKLIRQKTTTSQAEIDAYTKSVAEDSIETPLATFTFDDTDYKNEMAAIGNVITTYLLPIELGLTDQAKGIETMKAKLETAGIEKVQTAVQAQLDAYVKDYNSAK
ncbi:MAG TPA: ABC transporter substrate-binding protein [Ruminiclostridium sp.]